MKNWNLTCAITECSETHINCKTSGALMENRQSKYYEELSKIIVEQLNIPATCAGNICDY